MQAAVPFGGYKDSGLGREKGEYAMSNYTQVRSLVQVLVHNDVVQGLMTAPDELQW